MPTMLNSEHLPQLESHLHQYVVILLNERHNTVFAEHRKERFCFPTVQCPFNSCHAQQMSKYIAGHVEKEFGAQVELVFLHSSDIDTSWRNICWPCDAIFEVISPVDANTRTQIHPESIEYKWLSISTVRDLLAQPKSRWIHDVNQFSAFKALMGLKNKICKEGRIRAWMRPRWYTETTQEATNMLERLGYFMTDGFRQVRVSSDSALLRVETDKGRLYLKASTRKEGMITALLASFAPDLVQNPILVNEEKEWMLMNDYGSTIENKGLEEFGLVDFEKLCLPLGRLQLESQKYIQELKEAGAPVISAESFIGRTKSMLEDEWIRRRLGEDEEFGHDEDGMADLQEYFETVCEFLRDLYEGKQCLLSLKHGDIHRGNMIRGDDGGYVFIDWEAAEIDYAITDIDTLSSLVFPVVDQQRINIGPYFRLWEQHASPSELKNLWRCMNLRDELRIALETFESSVSEDVKPPMDSEELEQLKWALTDIRIEIETRKA